MCTTSGIVSFTVVAAGTAPFTYQWQYNNGGTWEDVTNDSPVGAAYTNENTATLDVAGITAAGSYQYRVYITNCSGADNATSAAATLTVNDTPTIPTAGTITQPSCALATGSVVLNGLPATGTWTVASSPAGISASGTGTSTTISGIAAGTYAITVANASGCTSAASANIVINAQPSTPTTPTTGTITQPTCALATGSVDLTGLPDTGTWTLASTPAGISANGSGSSTTIFGIAAGTYTVTVTNDAGCTSAASADIIVDVQPPTPNVADQATSILTGATFTETPIGVPVGTTYTWTAPTYTGGVTGGAAEATPQTSISGILTVPSGTGTATYAVTPTSGSCIGATFIVTVTVSSSCVPVTIGTQPADNSMCETSGTASFTVVAGGTAPFAYQWQYNNSGTWEAVTNGTPAGATYTNENTATLDVTGITSAGSYQYQAYITNCSGVNNATSDIVTLTVNAQPGVPSTGIITQPTCILPTGSVVLNDLPATGTWTINPGAITGSGTTYAITGLSAGNYTFTVTNEAGCTSPASSDVVITAASGSPDVPIVTLTQPTCSVATGKITVNAPVEAGMTYSIDGTDYTNTSGVFDLLTANTYTVTAQNSSGCISSGTTVTIITQPTPPETPVQTVDCASGFGNATVTVTNPTGIDLEYSLDGGSYQAGTAFTGVANGSHSITVMNFSGCSATGPDFEVTCGCTNGPTLTLSSTSGSTCASTPVTVSGNIFTNASLISITDDGDGSVSLSSIDTSPFDFSYTPAPGDAGKTVIITITSDNPLGSPCAAAVATYTLTVNAEPDAPIIGTITQPVSCGLNTGSIELTGLPATGTWTINPGAISGTGASTILTGLAAGSYNYTVTNETGCTSVASVNAEIKSVTGESIAPAETLSIYDGYNVSCFGQSDGFINISLAGDFAPYTFDWSGPDGFVSSEKDISGLKAGQYILTITDVNNCTMVETYELTQPQKLVMNIDRSLSSDGNFNLNCADSNTGFINITSANNVGPVNYIWSDGNIGSDRSNLPAGNYHVIVTDSNNCSADSTISITAPDSIKFAFDVTGPLCPENSDGSIFLTVTGGVSGGNFTYLWSDNSTGKNLTNIPRPGRASSVAQGRRSCRT